MFAGKGGARWEEVEPCIQQWGTQISLPSVEPTSEFQGWCSSGVGPTPSLGFDLLGPKTKAKKNRRKLQKFQCSDGDHPLQQGSSAAV